MTKTKAGPIAADRLKSFVERIERLREEKKAIGSDIRDVFAEAKGVGYDIPAMRWLIKEREVDVSDRDERDAVRDTYAHALGMAVNMVMYEGLSLREAEKRSGVSKSSIQRAIAVPAASQKAVPPIAETESATVVAPPVVPAHAEGGLAASPDATPGSLRSPFGGLGGGEPIKTTEPSELLSRDCGPEREEAVLTSALPLSHTMGAGGGEDSGLAQRAPDEPREPATQLSREEIKARAVALALAHSAVVEAERAMLKSQGIGAVGSLQGDRVDDFDLTIPRFLDRRLARAT